jgi:hypothetical protein
MARSEPTWRPKDAAWEVAVSPRQRNRRRERRAIVRLERVDLLVRGRVVGAFCQPVFKGRRYHTRWLKRAQSPATRTFPPIVGVMEERWLERIVTTSEQQKPAER